MNWKKTKTLVTGAGGFIGSHLAEELIRQGAKVRALVHYNGRNDHGNLEFADPKLVRKMDVVAGDITDPHFVYDCVKGQDVVFHLAAQIAIPFSYRSPIHFLNVNVKGTAHVLQACRREKVSRLVHTSTSEVYGTALYTPIDEKHPVQGQSPYSASKIGADMIAESFYRSYNLPVTIIRPFNTYGPRQSARAVIPTIILQALSSNVVRLGALNTVRDLNYVDDTVYAFLKTAESSKSIGRILNVGSGRMISVSDLARLIFKLIDVEPRIKIQKGRLRPENSEVMKLLCDSRLAKKLAGWYPRVKLEEGLLKTIEYYRANKHCYKPTVYNI